MHPSKSAIALILVLLLAGGGLLALWATSQTSAWAAKSPSSDKRIALAILGDSDSHSYHDTVSFPQGSPDRGGSFRAQTWQWGEVLAQLRGEQIDLGPWGTWGTRRLIARAQDALGWGGRNPRKMDYRYNFAQSGAVCNDLGPGQMAPQLVALMNQSPQQWARGVVVIRIGVNDVGTRQALTAWAKNGQDPALLAQVSHCVSQYKQAVALIQQAHPQTKIVLVGLFDNSHWAPLIEKWQDPVSMRNIAAGLEAFNTPLKQMVAQDKRLTFFDDQAWFRANWGGRTPEGKPDYRVAKIDGRWPTSNSMGNSPDHATVQDGHAGTIWNLLWTQALVRQLNASFQTGIPEISEQELAQFLEGKGIKSW